MDRSILAENGDAHFFNPKNKIIKIGSLYEAWLFFL
jgi:hypothetical protein